MTNEQGHEWHERVFTSMRIKCCVKCGFIKNEDRPNRRCPGWVTVGLRDDEPGKETDELA